MASVYSQGILGVKSPENCGCQELLSKITLVHYGWLRKKSLRNKIQLNIFNWPQLYVVLGERCLYYFSNEMSKKPKGAISLYGYNRILRALDIKSQEAPWAFKVEHIQPDVKSIYFSASSEREMVTWMKAIKGEMLLANNISSSNYSSNQQRDVKRPSSDNVSLASDSSWGSADYTDLESAVYSMAKDERRSLYWDSGSSNDQSNQGFKRNVVSESYSTVSENKAVPALPVRSPIKKDDAVYSLQKLPPDSNYTDSKAERYWPSVHFDGSRSSAAQIIGDIAENGVYLVRKSDDNSPVVVVYADGDLKKFKIVNKNNGKLSISPNDGPDFDDLEDLLYYYYFNDLPGKAGKLVTPFSLHPTYNVHK
ncbi:uncharacterized protein LOC131926940 [Physella acuta]|uniref:uncharacterized protein LOC131926940 n=1 Tax=Physella acuta TaxID=109671 RepID=UPI0027DAFEC3|nr:uncharacterized protein LOC131926940 [Physella acuta]XP_059138531.1 uncharacterized protein LOC131926940 [Physella acuta]XP_059138532.1 uncharacterized protein LOC131926940 [Physella acuta]XP_059138533.1 uncharacterized protein LOC131926940 [Physella acuta]XP_059138534.1 uncharacterized protein LOC131926940 [Physella acuta]